jgi:hypothetical protein
MQAEITSSSKRRKLGIGSIATALALGALVLPAASSAEVIGTHVVTPQTVTPHVVTPSAAPAPVPAPAPAPAPSPTSAPAPALTSTPTPAQSPTQLRYSSSRGSAPIGSKLHPPGPIPFSSEHQDKPFIPLADSACDVLCKTDWMGWYNDQANNTPILDDYDPTGWSRFNEWIIARESVHDELVGIYAEELAASLDGVMHPFGPAPATQTSPPDPSQGGSQDPDDSGAPAQTPSTSTPATPTTGGNGVSFASEITGFISGAVCPKGNFQSVNNGVEDNTGGSGACF